MSGRKIKYDRQNGQILSLIFIGNSCSLSIINNLIRYYLAIANVDGRKYDNKNKEQLTLPPR